MNINKAEILVKILLNKYNLNHYKLRFSRATRCMGRCYINKTTIELSKSFVELNNIKTVRETILHEIAHALTPGHKHDSIWRDKAIEIGCSGKIYAADFIAPPDNRKKWKAMCPVCGYYYIRKMRKRCSCGKCSNGRYNEEFRVQYIAVLEKN